MACVSHLAAVHAVVLRYFCSQDAMPVGHVWIGLLHWRPLQVVALAEVAGLRKSPGKRGRCRKEKRSGDERHTRPHAQQSKQQALSPPPEQKREPFLSRQSV